MQVTPKAKELQLSLTRRMLKAMGIEDDTIDQIIEAHTETTDSLKAERDRYKSEAGKVGELTDELEKVRGQLKDAQDNDEYDELKKRYDEQSQELAKLQESSKALKSDFDGYKAEVEAKESKRAKEEAYKTLLEKAGISPKYVGKVLKVTDLDGVEIQEDGTVKDADKLTEGIRSEWKEFIPTTSTNGTNPATPPDESNTSGVSERAKGIIESYYQKKYGKTEE